MKQKVQQAVRQKKNPKFQKLQHVQASKLEEID